MTPPTDCWEHRIVRAENAVVWLVAPWFALWQMWRNR